MTDERPAPEVLVAGAGPVGLTVAHELTRRNVRVRIVDKATRPAATSRATAVHARTLEIWHQMGVLGDLLPRGQRVVHFTLHQGGRTLIRFDTNYRRLPTRFPFSLMVGQVVTERVLRERLRDLGVEVEWGVELVSFEQTTEGVTALLRRANGDTEEVESPWLVGADGAHSTVRKQLGLQLLGEATQTWMNADIVLDADLPEDSNHLLHTGNGTILLVPFPEPRTWRAVDTVDIEGADDWDAVRDRLAGKISRALGQPVKVATPTWVSVFTAQQRMITRMRVGRCFVAGDAAHVHSPASGQGMNTGIQDAYNVAWKLADVIRGLAEEKLLDSYGAERVPIGEKLLGTTRTATALVALRNTLAPVLLPVGLGVLKALRPVKRTIEGKMMRGFCGLALHYADGPLSRPMTVERHGVLPGHRVACDEAAERAHAGWRALCVELTDPRWTLLGFAGDHPGVPAALEHVDRHFGQVVSVRTVRGSADSPAGAGTGPHPLADPGDGLRRGLGALPGDYVLVRPDGYLAAKGPFDGIDGLTALLRASCLVSHTVGATQGIEGEQ